MADRDKAVKTPEGKWLLWDLATGEQLERWPVDVKQLLANGTHSLEPPEGVTPVLPPGPPASVQPTREVVAQPFVAPESKKKKAE